MRSKLESRNPKQIRILNPKTHKLARFEFCNLDLSFAFVSDFDIRISDLSRYKVIIHG